MAINLQNDWSVKFVVRTASYGPVNYNQSELTYYVSHIIIHVVL